MLTFSATMPSGRKPGCTSSSFCRLRTNNSAPTSSTRENATCAVTSARRRPWRSRPAVMPRPPARIAAAGAIRVARSAGSRPNSRQVPMAIAAVNPSIRRSSCRPTKTGLSGVLRNAISVRLSTCASPTPRTVPSTASSRLSESSCRTSLRSRGADRLPHRHLAFPHVGPRQQQVRQVGAGDQQHQSGGRQQQRKRALVLLAQARNSVRRHVRHQFVRQVIAWPGRGGRSAAGWPP